MLPLIPNLSTHPVTVSSLSLFRVPRSLFQSPVFNEYDHRPDFRAGAPLSTSFQSALSNPNTQRNLQLSNDDVGDDDDIRYTSSDYAMTESESHDSHPQASRRVFNRLDFARTYDVIALRVPSVEWRSISHRIKGHMLNWIGVDNMVRVDGDDIDSDDSDVRDLLCDDKGEKVSDIGSSVLRAIYGSTTHPDVQFRGKFGKISSGHYENLECISLPEIKHVRVVKKERQRKNLKSSKTKPYKVEVEALHGLQFKRSVTCLQGTGLSTAKWTGPTRLLLLDTKYATMSFKELPVVVQVLLNEHLSHSRSRAKREIVRCKITLFYEYWSMEEILMELIPEVESAVPVVKIVGHVAQLKLGNQYAHLKDVLGKVILDKHRLKVKTVINKSEPPLINGQCGSEILAGNHSLTTIITENGIRFHINLAKLYWNDELATERHRLIQKFDENDIVCDINAGVGALSLASAKKVWRVFANSENTEALKYLAKNVEENRLQAKVELYNLNNCEFLRKLLGFRKPVLMNRIILDLSTTGDGLLDVIAHIFNECAWPATQPLPVIHVYGYSDALDPEASFLQFICAKIGSPVEHGEVRRVWKNKESGQWLTYACFRLVLRTGAFQEHNMKYHP